MRLPRFRVVKIPGAKKVVGLAGAVTSGQAEHLLQKLEKVDGKLGTVSQAFDAAMIAGPEHLIHAARLAIVSRCSGHCFADSFKLDLICWVSAERQIGKALKKAGLKPGQLELALLVIGDSAQQVEKALSSILSHAERDDRVLDISPRKEARLKRFFSISKRELQVAPLKHLIFERMALLSLED
ncbi:MAG: KEOPS complex subunit Cgi121 [Candidatus Hadarchaeota archaeon]